MLRQVMSVRFRPPHKKPPATWPRGDRAAKTRSFADRRSPEHDECATVENPEA